MTVFVLVHSPSVGPATWLPVADRLRGRGRETIVPSLLDVADAGVPYWPAVVARVRAGLEDADPGEPVVLVAHSNAGLFVPVLSRGLDQPVACSVFADASVPSASGATPVAGQDFLPFLRGLAGQDGRLPRWTDWWAEEDVVPMLPDPQVRRAVTAEQRRLPLDYFLQRIPAPSGWDDHPCGYLLFSDAYQEEAAEAGRRGWPVRTIRGEHLHQVVDPDGVAAALLALVDRAGNAA